MGVTVRSFLFSYLKLTFLKEIFLIYYKAYKFAINRLNILKEVMYVKLYDYLVRRNKQKNIIRKRDIFIFIISISL